MNMLVRKSKSIAKRFVIFFLVGMLLTACSSKATNTADKIELGQKYLSEANYTEAVAAFTEVIKFDPSNIEAYMGRAEAYKCLKQYNDAKADYTEVIGRTDEMPYAQAQAYTNRAEVYELTDEATSAESDYSAAIALLNEDNVGKKENVADALVRKLKIKVLQLHAVLCKKLGLNDKAMEDYEKLAELDVVQQKTGDKEYTKTSILDEINKMRKEAGCALVVLDDMCQSEADECASRLKKSDDGSISKEEEYQQMESIYASVSLKCDAWLMTFGESDLVAGNPEYTRVSIGISDDGSDNGEYVVVIYY